MKWHSSLAAIPTTLFVFGCGDSVVTKPDQASVSGPAIGYATIPGLDSAKIAKLRGKYGQGGCAAATTDRTGSLRGVAMRRQDLPFSVPPIQRDPKSGKGNGRIVQMTVRRAGQADVVMNCWVPNTVSLSDIAASINSSKNARWASVFSRVKTARVIPAVGQRTPLSREALALAAETLMPGADTTVARGASFDDLCIPVKGFWTFWDDDEGGWVALVIDLTTCDGGDDLFLYVADGPYGDDPYVVVSANSYQPMGTDSVAFSAELVSDVRLSPQGWTWTRTTAGSGDPWTQACSGTSTTCEIPIYGPGRMKFSYDDGNGGTVWADVAIAMTVPADIDSTGVPDEGDTEDATLSTAHFATTPISDAQASAILDSAKHQPDWRYTQGCYSCDTIHHPTWTEPPKNLANHYGDCTDFVWAVANLVLGGTTWPWNASHIARTVTFGTSGRTPPSNIGYWGYLLTDSAHARPGDVVVSNPIVHPPAPNENDTIGGGHAGILMHTVNNANGTAGFFLAWANNGLPASSLHANKDTTTGPYTFKNKPGWILRFFRQGTP